MTAHQPVKLHQRSAGHASAAFAMRAGRARVQDLCQQGCAKAIILDEPELVFLNTAGGLTGGDVLSYELTIGPDMAFTATTQTAERAYRSNSGVARMGVTMTVGANAHLDWLPQETILFDQSNVRRRTEITLAPGATCLMAETVVLGRAAMGETVTRLDFHDWRMIRRGDTPLHLEALSLTDERLSPSAAGLGDARALATVVLIAPDAADRLPMLRACLDGTDIRASASAMQGRLVIRMMARDGWPLRRQMAQVLTLLRCAPLPRVWQS